MLSSLYHDSYRLPSCHLQPPEMDAVQVSQPETPRWSCDLRLTPPTGEAELQIPKWPTHTFALSSGKWYHISRLLVQEIAATGEERYMEDRAGQQAAHRAGNLVAQGYH